MKAQAVWKFPTNVSVNPIKPLFSNTTSPVSSHSWNSVVTCNNNFLSNSFTINPAIPSLSRQPIIKTSVKSIIHLDRKSDDVLNHKSLIPGTLVTLRIDSIFFCN